MDKIKQFNQQQTTSAKFTLVINGKNEPETTCQINFLFIKIGAPFFNRFFYIPDYKPVLSVEKRQITFDPKSKSMPVVIFRNNDVQTLQLWNDTLKTYGENPDIILEEFIKYDLSYEENYGDEKNPCIVKLSDLCLFSIQQRKSTVQYQITSRTKVLMPDNDPSIGLYESNSPDEIKRFLIPDFSAILDWSILLKVCALSIDKKEQELFDDSGITVISIDEQEPTQYVKVEKDSEIIPQPVPQTSYDQSLVSSLPSRRRTERRLSCDVDVINQIGSAVKKQCDEIKERASKYKISINIPKPKPEPQIIRSKEPEFKVKKDIKYEVVEKKPHQKMNKEDLLKILHNQLSNPSVDIKRWIPDYKYLNFSFVPQDNYQQNPGCTFEDDFEKSDPSKTCILIAAMITNGFSGASISEAYKIQKQSSRKQDLCEIIKKYQNGIFDYILGSKDLQGKYETWAMINDSGLITKLKMKNNEININAPLPDILPYQFPLNPVKAIENWFHNLIYDIKTKDLKPEITFFNFANLMLGLFNNYLSGESLQAFVKEIIKEIALKPSLLFSEWATLKNSSNFTDAFLSFWVASFKDGKLLNNFMEFFKFPHLLGKFYLSCSSMQNPNDIQKIAEIINAISFLGIPTDFDIKFSTTDKSIFKNFVGRIGFH